jgi:cyclopropane-fatty-acyl-phospholipid synthase
MWYASLLEKNIIPDVFIRQGIRNLLKKRLEEEDKGNAILQHNHLMNLVSQLKKSPIAVQTSAANEQHYEVPTRFFQLALGKHLKYSCGYWSSDHVSFDQSERDMLELTCQRAALQNGHDILELGCGWGSLSLFMAEKFPKSRITAVSNSKTQKTYIDSEAWKKGITNLTVITEDMNYFTTDKQFDRVVSVEMFEHMRNYELLLEKVNRFLYDRGKLFVHIFTHKEFAYLFEVKDESDWMSKYFFTGGIMPSDDLLLYFTDHFKIEKHWRVSGLHYSKTSQAWLQNMDRNKAEVLQLFEKTYGKDQAQKWWVYWRIFFMSCAELWGFRDGNEWMVSHYLFEKR